MVGLVSYEVFKSGEVDSEEDEDYKDNNGHRQTQHPVYSFEINATTTVRDIKIKMAQKVAKIGHRNINIQNLQLGTVKWGELSDQYDDDYFVEKIDQSGSTNNTVLVEITD